MLALRRRGEELFAFEAPGQFVPEATREPQPGDRLFFTDEDSLGRYLGDDRFDFFPSKLEFPLDDKFEFARLVRNFDYQPVPFWSSADEVPLEAFPILVKSRKSWKRGKRLQRGRVCSEPGQLVEEVTALKTQGFAADELFFQQWIGDGVTNCYSIAGFFDFECRSHPYLVTTRKLLASRRGLGPAIAIRVVPNDSDLVSRCTGLLGDLKYVGPFEMEYSLCPRRGVFFELELNPRFWLQHSFFVHCFDNVVVRLYCGESGVPVPVTDTRQPLWVSGIHAVASLLTPWRAQSRLLLQEMLACRGRGDHVILDPPLGISIRLAGRQLRSYLPGVSN